MFQHRLRRRVPVVGVDDVGFEFELLAELERGFAQKHEAVVVVGIAEPAFVGVESRAAVKLFEIYEIDRHVAAGQRILVDPGPELSHRSHRHAERSGHVFQLAFVDAVVARHHDDDVVAQFFQGFGQSTRHIRQSAGLGERYDFGSGKKYIQRFVHFGSLHCGINGERQRVSITSFGSPFAVRRSPSYIVSNNSFAPSKEAFSMRVASILSPSREAPRA